MGLSKAELKNLVKEAVQELLADKDFIDAISKKVSDKIVDLEKNVHKNGEKIVSLGAKLNENVIRQGNEASRFRENVNQQGRRILDLENKIDQIQQNEKLKNICLYGLKPENGIGTREQVVHLINSSLKVEIKDTDITACYRIGKDTSRLHPVIVKFECLNIRNAVISKSSNLKGTKMGITEDFTRKRLSLYKKAQQVFDRGSVVSRSGNIFIWIGGTKHKVLSEDDLQQLKK